MVVGKEWQPVLSVCDLDARGTSLIPVYDTQPIRKLWRVAILLGSPIVVAQSDGRWLSAVHLGYFAASESLAGANERRMA